MASFKLADIVVDRVVCGLGETSDGELLYMLTNCQDANIDITSDSTDAVDGTGAVIKTFYRGKTGELTITNSLISLPIIEQMSGSAAVVATTAAPLSIPMIITTSKATLDLPGITDAGANSNIVVNAISENGALGQAYTSTDYTITAPSGDATVSSMTITPKTGDTRWVVKYDRNVTENGIKIVNRSDKFPKTHKLTLKVLIVDPCETDVIRAAYVVIPNFQPSPDISFNFATDATLDFTGRLMTSYCGTEKVIVMQCNKCEAA